MVVSRWRGADPVDIHLPKVPHSWRELGREIGIIVIDVMIALFFEQIAQAWDWREKVHAADKAMRLGGNRRGPKRLFGASPFPLRVRVPAPAEHGELASFTVILAVSALQRRHVFAGNDEVQRGVAAHVLDILSLRQRQKIELKAVANAELCDAHAIFLGHVRKALVVKCRAVRHRRISFD